MSSNIRINKICEFCGNDFIAQTIKTRFCSQKCGSKSYKARKRDMTNDVPEETSEGMRSYDLEVLKKQIFYRNAVLRDFWNQQKDHLQNDCQK